jgi:threonine synthase
MSLALPDDPAPEADDGVWLACVACGRSLAPFDDVVYRCPDCDGLLEVRYADLPTFADFEGTGVSASDASGGSSRAAGRDGVWRYADALPPVDGVTLAEGGTPLHAIPDIEADVGVESLRVKNEGANPTGAFKDRGMTVGVGVARRLGIDRLACASTGNTSAALSAYGTRAGLEVLVLLPAGKVAAGKVAQASLHGARILEVDGNFDTCLDVVADLADRGMVYLLNSVNPFRLEGQKTIGLEMLEQFCADPEAGRGVVDPTDATAADLPDRIVLPVGNAGNTAALYKVFRELVAAGALKPDAVPKLTGVQAEGAAPMVEAVEDGADAVARWDEVETRATAIRIGNPVNAPKALPGIRETGGTAVAVSDAAITDAQRSLAEAGVGVEPASAASLAGLRELREQGVVGADEEVVCLTTGHLLKDPDAAAAAGGDTEAVPGTTAGVVDHLSD